MGSKLPGYKKIVQIRDELIPKFEADEFEGSVPVKDLMQSTMDSLAKVPEVKTKIQEMKQAQSPDDLAPLKLKMVVKWGLDGTGNKTQ